MFQHCWTVVNQAEVAIQDRFPDERQELACDLVNMTLTRVPSPPRGRRWAN